jgi:hypothetical protein
MNMPSEATTHTKEFRPVRTRALRGHSAVSQARVILLVMINVAQLWVLAATVEAALARHYRVLIPLVAASFVCWLITISIIFWWRPVSRRYTSTGYIRQPKR